MLDAALRTPLLVETPWDLPRELVLVHAPPFDSGFPLAEEIVGAAAAGASEILALFSRQLSDRELDLYGRLAQLGKPMTFVHTIADNETPADRRNVVSLADRYLARAGIVPQRIFTVSTRRTAAVGTSWVRCGRRWPPTPRNTWNVSAEPNGSAPNTHAWPAQRPHRPPRRHAARCSAACWAKR